MKYIVLIVILLAAALLTAETTFYPLTTLGEAFVTSNSADCDYTYLGLNDVLNQTNRSEFINARLYHASGDLSSPSVESRISSYFVSTFPTVMFNGWMGVVGPSPAAAYQTIADEFQFAASPISISITGFSTASGNLSGTVKMYDTALSIANEHLVMMLVENDVAGATNVTRQVLTQNISLSGAGNTVNFNGTFTLNAAWNVNNLWAIVCVQTEDGPIRQSISTLSLPTYCLRCAYDTSNGNNLVGDTNATLTGQPLVFYNLGMQDDMQLRIDVTDAPADWFFNYCDDIGNCYPGNVSAPVSLEGGGSLGFHLNLWLGSTGIAHFSFVMTSPNIGTLSVPFVCRSSDYVSNDDNVLHAALQLGTNSPNPFRGATSFTVNADKAAQGSIQIFNLRGQMIAETALQSLHQGENRISWQVPQNLPAGVYFYRLKDNPATLKRMLLLK